MLLCVVLICRGYSGDGCLTSSILFKYERSKGHLFALGWARVRRVARGVMYCEWYGVCDFVVLSVVEVCADYGGVNVFQVCGVVCLVYVVCFLRLGVVIVVLSVMRVVVGVLLWVECVFRRVDVVCLCLLYTQLLFGVRCFVLSVVC